MKAWRVPKQADADFQQAFLSIPNLPDASVPVGQTEADNQVVATWGNAALIIHMRSRIFDPMV